MATPAFSLSPALQTKADTMLADLLAHIASRQDAYYAAHKRYFQGICTHTKTPADGVETTPNLAVKPSYQAEDWLDAGFMLPDKMPAALEIHTYDGPKGEGWLVILTVEEGGQVWQRVKATGPEAKWLTRDWDLVVENPEQEHGLDR